MEQKFKRGTLPCLRCMDESWEREDRLLLFYYLKKIFAIEYDYFALLPSSYVMDHEGNVTEQLQAADMEAFEQSIVGDVKKVSCAKIQGASFSFGTYNKHLCFLCPYSGLYKNRYEVEEKMILYHQLEFYMLYSLMEQSGLKMDKIVRSYYPIIQNGVLKDAMPLSDIAELFVFEQMPLVKYREDRENFDISCCSKISEMMEKKFKAKIKRRPYYVRDDEAYKTAMIQCGQEAYKEIANLDSSEIAYQRTIKSLDRMISLDRKIIERYFHAILRDQGRYKPRDVKEYEKIVDIQKEDPTLPSFVRLAIDDGREKDGVEKAEPIEKTFGEENNLEEKSRDDTSGVTNEKKVLPLADDVNATNIIDADIPVAEGFNECKEFTLEDITRIASESCQEEELVEEDVNADDEVQSKVKSKECRNENVDSDIFERNNLDEVPWLSDLKEYNSYDELFDELCKSVKSIYIEPAVKDNVKGLLIVGGEKAFFYSGELYGNKLFLKFLKAELQIYTSHIFEAAGYLHKVKVYGVQLLDVEIARKLSKMEDVPVNEGESLLDVMKQYKKNYETYIREGAIEESIHLAEKFALIACSDGHIPPFKKLDRLYVEDDGILKPKFTEKNIPEVKGTFYWLQISLMNSEKVAFVDRRIYKQICVALDKYLNFAKGLSYLLRVDNGGILLYVTGDEMEQTDGGTYLKACARREMKKVFGVHSKFNIQILHQSFCP